MVNFNYYRCVEHFLVQAIRLYFGLDEGRAQVCVATMVRYHPYGTVAPWRECSEHVRFGDGAFKDSQPQLLDLVRRIRTYSEEATEGADISVIKEAVKNAQVIVFLGFAYHPLNMKVLQPGEGSRRRDMFTAQSTKWRTRTPPPSSNRSE